MWLQWVIRTLAIGALGRTAYIEYWIIVCVSLGDGSTISSNQEGPPAFGTRSQTVDVVDALCTGLLFLVSLVAQG